MKILALSALLLPLIGAGGFFGAKTYTDGQYGAPDLGNGEQLYMTNCRACHGEKGHGDGVAAASLPSAPDNIHEELTNPFGFKVELIGTVLNGEDGEYASGVMPAFGGTLTEGDVNDIFGYIESIN